MDTYTSIAVDAFRKQEQARRRLAKAEAESLKWVRRIPREEMPLWFAWTELVRLEEELRTVTEAHDTEAREVTEEAIWRAREAVRELDGATEASGV